MTVLDISKSGEQIGEKLFALLSEQQKHELIQYVLAKEESASSIVSKCNSSPASIFEANCRLTEIQTEGLYFCLENRIVYICETEIALTVKEFDIFALLIMNPCRVLTYDMIIDLVWHENLDYYFSHFAAELPILVTHDKDHGRMESREYRLLPDLS